MPVASLRPFDIEIEHGIYAHHRLDAAPLGGIAGKDLHGLAMALLFYGWFPKPTATTGLLASHPVLILMRPERAHWQH
jgi:hypothetical protein